MVCGVAVAVDVDGRSVSNNSVGRCKCRQSSGRRGWLCGGVDALGVVATVGGVAV